MKSPRGCDRDHLVDLTAIQTIESQADDVGQDAASRGGDLRSQPVRDSRRRVQRDRGPDGIGGAGREPLVDQELARVVGPVDLEPLLLVGVGRREAGVVEERGEVEQFRIRLQACVWAWIAPKRNTRREWWKINWLAVSRIARVASAAAAVCGISTPAMTSDMASCCRPRHVRRCPFRPRITRIRPRGHAGGHRTQPCAGVLARAQQRRKPARKGPSGTQAHSPTNCQSGGRTAVLSGTRRAELSIRRPRVRVPSLPLLRPR